MLLNQIDRCNRLWVVDSGSIGNNSVCPPKLLIFDLGTNLLIRKIDIPEELARTPEGVVRLVTIEVDVGTDCSITKVTYEIDRLSFSPQSQLSSFFFVGARLILQIRWEILC